MKIIKYILPLIVMTVLTVSCKNGINPEIKTVEVETEVAKEFDPNATYAKAEFTIDGMTCQIGCAATIQKKISNMEGVKSATVDFDTRLAMVEYNESKVTPKSLEETVTKVADIYVVSDMKTVDDFSTKEACTAESCTKACCTEKADGEKLACAENCQKACCTKKVKA